MKKFSPIKRAIAIRELRIDFLQNPVPVDTLKPQDVLLACQLALSGKISPTHEVLGKMLHLAPSTVYEALKRCRQAKLVTDTEYGPKVVQHRLYDFLVHAVPVLYYPRRVASIRGIPTALFYSSFRGKFTKPGDLATVWPYSKGKEIGEGLLPIYPSIPIACSQNVELYELMATIEVLRVGKTREKAVALTYLDSLINGNKQEVSERKQEVSEREQEEREGAA